MNILVYAGIALIAVVITVVVLIGVLDVVRGTPVRDVVADEKGGKSPAVREPFFPDAMQLLTGTHLHGGHDVELFMNGDETYSRLWRDLRAAKSCITLQLYYCNKGKMADELQAILLDRARAGVEIHFLYDSFGTTLKKEYFDTLRAAGVHAEKFRPFSWRSMQKVQHRAHIRVIVIDGKIGYTGGFGIDDKWYGNGRTKDQWRDTNVRFIGAAVRQLQATFVVCWAETTGHLLTGPLLFPALENAEDDKPDTSAVRAGLLHASPTIGSTSAERFFALSIAGARERLFLSNSYFVPDLAFRNLLCAAAKRGVDVRILTVSKATDVKSTWYAGRARYEAMLVAGVRIFEYQPVMMHAKTITVDGLWSSCGSMNADNRSMSFNDESNLVMLDEGVAAKMEKLFTADLDYSEEIVLSEFKKRGLAERLKEHACHLIWRVL
ncbi:MAG: phospholipase D-like domain-containing protein [Gemmatimonadota bacterium]|nr:phospholipase D-like domain-containing protein [Gemmatimonadota bacterium]